MTINDRKYWIQTMEKIVRPVFMNLANGTLKLNMPIEGNPDRGNYTYLEAFARSLCGIAPWLESGPEYGEEAEIRSLYSEWARGAIEAATDPESPDYMNFSEGEQPIVDAAFLAHAILRAPTQLYEKLSPYVKKNLIRALTLTRSRKPFFNNWLLFAAMIETALCKMGEEWDPMRIDFALKQHEQWYVGDGLYSDGMDFHADYYNSFVIQPMLVDIIDHMAVHSKDWEEIKAPIIERAIRFAAIQERSISPEGTFPVVGRSLAYRFGAFQHLAQMCLQHRLPLDISATQIRCALTAVIKRIIDAPNTFDENGWLTIGLVGSQPSIGEEYISTGSLYLCTAVFLPLGLPEKDIFWNGDMAWTSKKIWSGSPSVSIDSAY